MNYGEIGAIVIFFIGVYGVIARRNITKTVISLGIMEAAIILYFVAAGGKNSSSAPISDSATAVGAGAADAVPQALMITAIVIGIAVTAVALTMFIYLYHKYGTTNWEKARKMRDNE